MLDTPLHVLHGIDPAARWVVAMTQRHSAEVLREVADEIEVRGEVDEQGRWLRARISLSVKSGLGVEVGPRVLRAFRALGLSARLTLDIEVRDGKVPEIRRRAESTVDARVLRAFREHGPGAATAELEAGLRDYLDGRVDVDGRALS